MKGFKRKTKTYPYLGLKVNTLSTPGKLHRFADWLDDWHWTRIMASFSSLALILTLTMLSVDITDRYEQRTNQAWALVTTKASGNSGKREALEYLNKEIFFLKKRAPLIGIDLSVKTGPGVFLAGIQLHRANLIGAKLSKANLSGANLSGANLSKAKPVGAKLSGAKLSGADLSGAKNLKQHQLDCACGDENTALPAELSIMRDC